MPRFIPNVKQIKSYSRMNLALFDFDGTITDREMFRPFLSATVHRRRLTFAKLVLAPIGIAYKLGIVSGRIARACAVRLCLSGVSLSKFDTASRAFVASHLHGVIRPVAMDRINWHKAQGDKVVVVSGGFGGHLSHWCSQYGLELICSRLEHQSGKLTGRYAGIECSGPEKVRRILEEYDLNAYSTVYAYGDTKDDLDMLRLAHKKFYQWKELSA